MALGAPISMAEFHDALQQMPKKKAPGPDGFPTESYKELCIMKSDVVLGRVASSLSSIRSVSHIWGTPPGISLRSALTAAYAH